MSPMANYILIPIMTFTLYDDHGGDLPDCGGVVLSSCNVSQNFATAGPSPVGNFHPDNFYVLCLYPSL